MSLMSAPASAQESEATPDVDLWEGRWAPAWDTGFWAPPGSASLDVRAGYRPASRRDAAGAQRGSAETYVVAELRLPWTLFSQKSSGVFSPHQDSVEAAVVSAPGDLPAEEGSGDEALSRATDFERWAGRAREARAKLGATGLAPKMARGEPLPGPRAGAGSEGSGEEPSEGSSASDNSAPAPRFGRGEQTPERSGSPARAAGSQAEQLDASRGSAANLVNQSLPFEFVAEVVERAQRSRGLEIGERRLDSLGRRSRWAGLLPELRVRGAAGVDQSRSIDSAGPLLGDETTRDTVDSLAEVRLTFHLARLLVGNTEPSLERLRQQLHKERVALQQEVLELLLDWNRARLSLIRDDLEEAQRLELELEALAATTRLGLLTSGWFRGLATLEAFP